MNTEKKHNDQAELLGSCLCKKVQYRVIGEPLSASHCYCTQCQKQHGAAYASYINIPLSSLEYLKGEELLVSFSATEGIIRRFCGDCGSNIEWRDLNSDPAITSVTLGTLDSEINLDEIRKIYTDTLPHWSA